MTDTEQGDVEKMAREGESIRLALDLLPAYDPDATVFIVGERGDATDGMEHIPLTVGTVLKALAALKASPPPALEAGDLEVAKEALRLFYIGRHVSPEDSARRDRILAALPPAPLQGDQLAKLRAGIYVASRASVPERGEMWRALRASGVKINASWIDEDGEGQSHDLGELWERIAAEVQQSTALILYAEAADFPLKGAYVEVGMALAAGIPVVVVAPGVELDPHSLRPLGSWARHPLVRLAATIDEALSATGEE